MCVSTFCAFVHAHHQSFVPLLPGLCIVMLSACCLMGDRRLQEASSSGSSSAPLVIDPHTHTHTHTHTDSCSRLSSQSFRQHTHKDTVMCLFDFSPSSFIVCRLCLHWSAVFLAWSSFKSPAVSIDLSSLKVLQGTWTLKLILIHLYDLHEQMRPSARKLAISIHFPNGCLSFTCFKRKMHILVKWRTFWQETKVIIPTLSTEATTINKNGSSWQLL